MNVYAVAVQLSKSIPGGTLTTMTLSTRTGDNEDEVKGAAVSFAMKAKPGFSVDNILCIEVVTKADEIRLNIDEAVRYQD